MTTSRRPFPTNPLVRLIPPVPSTAPVNAVTWSSNSAQYLLTGSSDRSIRLWNPFKQPSSSPSSSKGNGQLIQTYSAHGYEVLDLDISADNAKFVSCGGDKTVFVWDVQAGKTVRRFAGHAGRVEGVKFGGAGSESVIVSGSFDGTVKVWDLRAGGDTRALMTLNEAKDAVSAIAVQGHEIWAGSADGRVRVYDVAMGAVDVDVFPAAVGSVVPTAEGDGVLVSTLDSSVRFMDRASGRCLKECRGSGFTNEEFRVRSALGAAESVAISGGEDGQVWVWDLLTGEVREKVWHDSEKRRVVGAVAWNQRRNVWASAGGDGTVVVWGAGDGG
ncbi:WD40 repeat-like protein [Polychaeton citri CBS 116435]|uniref:WD40 repeat-like protein n=1 Tax=Polychaeton citri CBS 116435 TaxID=1314669 RepID=A0A9P4QDA4_9PEZI|nr:WD40 repeat-like protein [Polychaeton citri CBS 116435]